jgi:hypothetical protein
LNARPEVIAPGSQLGEEIEAAEEGSECLAMEHLRAQRRREGRWK